MVGACFTFTAWLIDSRVNTYVSWRSNSGGVRRTGMGGTRTREKIGSMAMATKHQQGKKAQCLGNTNNINNTAKPTQHSQTQHHHQTNTPTHSSHNHNTTIKLTQQSKPHHHHYHHDNVDKPTLGEVKQLLSLSKPESAGGGEARPTDESRDSLTAAGLTRSLLLLLLSSFVGVDSRDFACQI